jgi:hypothetical protein
MTLGSTDLVQGLGVRPRGVLCARPQFAETLP